MPRGGDAVVNRKSRDLEDSGSTLGGKWRSEKQPANNHDHTCDLC